MRENDNWLFVFDNADAYAREEKPVSPNKVLADYLPQGLDGKRHILITSRYGNWQGKTQDIDVFTPQEARDFLTRYAKLENDSFQDELVEKLGYLPLALEQAAAFICATKGSYERYLELFSRYSVEMLQRHPGEDDPKRIVYTTWNISRDQIKRQSALQLLDLLSFFASDNIDLQWFRKGVVHLPEPLQTDIQNELECEEILADLLRYFLITRQNEHLSLHRLVQEVIRGSLETEKRNEAADCCLHICGKCVFLDFSTVESRRRYSELQPHILSVLNASGDHLAELRANLYTFLGKGADEQGNYDKALEGFQKALAIREKVLRPDHPDTATSYNNVAMMYEKMGEYGKALEGCEKALAIRKKTPGPDHLDTATFYNNVAGVYYRKGEYDRALGEFEKALAIQEKLLGQNHPHTAQTYHNIALVYASKGEYDKALEGFQKTLAINEKVLGPEHPSTATIYNSIAGAYDHKGEYEKALEGFQKALAIREKVLGPDHPDTATTYNGIARVYDHKGEYDKALEGYKKTLAIREKLLGPDHPDTATSHNHIAGVYDSKGEYDKALRMYEKVLAIDEKVLGPDHPDTAASYNNIAFVYSHKAEYDEALRWYVCAFRVLPARLGDHHPTTRTVFENMFETYEKSGKTEDFQDWLDGKLTESDRCNEKR
ncbi:tetratricopeptide repeat protein [Desulfosarcina sp. OttesenSCG-928-B08]|nr:tetratricopeptide repeat protein [Desulfosarcina sp. OttesenSCG-928-B08]